MCFKASSNFTSDNLSIFQRLFWTLGTLVDERRENTSKCSVRTLPQKAMFSLSLTIGYLHHRKHKMSHCVINLFVCDHTRVLISNYRFSLVVLITTIQATTLIQVCKIILVSQGSGGFCSYALQPDRWEVGASFPHQPLLMAILHSQNWYAGMIPFWSPCGEFPFLRQN